MIKPDYHNGSIVNLMASILQALGGRSNGHAPLPDLDPALIARAQNVVLLVIDGLGYHYLASKGAHSTLQQNIQRKLTTVFPSTTATAITTFMTGLAPQQHGLTGWFTYFRELGGILSVLPFKPRYGGASLGEMNIDVKGLYGHTPIFDLLDVSSYMVMPDAIAYSDYSLAHRGKAAITPYESLQECFDLTHDIVRASREKKYIYTYWPMFDAIAHEKGVASEEIAAHFRDIDHAFAGLINKLKGTDTLLIATADHGIIDSSARACIELEDHAKLMDMLTMPLCGERRMAYCYVESGKQVEFEQYISETFAEDMKLLKSSTLIANHFYGLGSPHPQLHHRVGDYTLSMKKNLTIMDTVPGERRFYHVGTHGGCSEQEMYVPLILLET